MVTFPPQLEGMTLRDWFAGMAMAGWLADPNTKARGSQIAYYAYQQADEMLHRRALKTPVGPEVADIRKEVPVHTD